MNNYLQNFRTLEGPNEGRQGAGTSADNKHANAIFEDLNMPSGPSADMMEMDQRQRIFEEVIISRVKVVQDFVKQRYNKLNKQMHEVKANQLVSGELHSKEDQLLDKMHLDDLMHKSHLGLVSSTGTKGTIIEVVEEALRWRLEANNRKQNEIFEDLQEKVGK